MPVSERISAKQYGVRYGRRLKEKIGKIEQARKLSDTCPYCHYKKVERLAAGIWFCNKCQSKFTGRAYVIGKKVEEVVGEEAAAVEVKAAEPQEEEEEETADSEA